MGKIKNTVNNTQKKIKDWWSDPYNQGTVGIIATTVVGGFTFFMLGRLYGELEAETNYSPAIMKLVCSAGKLEGENALLREMIENANIKE